MSVSEQRAGISGEATVFSHKFQDVKTPAVEVFHEGRQVRLRLQATLEDRAVMIPLRNGFPLYAPDRNAQCFCVIDSSGQRVALAIRIPDFGLRVMFDQAPKMGDYFIRTQTPYGRA